MGLRRFLTVLKLRTSGHDPVLREFLISNRGLEIGESIEDAQLSMSGLALTSSRSRTSRKLRAQAPRQVGMGLILIVDDEFGIVEALSDFLQDEGYRTATALNGRQALERMALERPTLVSWTT